MAVSKEEKGEAQTMTRSSATNGNKNNRKKAHLDTQTKSWTFKDDIKVTKEAMLQNSHKVSQNIYFFPDTIMM